MPVVDSNQRDDRIFHTFKVLCAETSGKEEKNRGVFSSASKTNDVSTLMIGLLPENLGMTYAMRNFCITMPWKLVYRYLTFCELQAVAEIMQHLHKYYES
ncbi:hypothetical protein KP509_07G074300 [Ceratopteris richardii]|uniref:Uncharacterized protein n=1 Tax=Ceratopteris richardii TaxID=49495 RepID=A0A8T2UGA8_CERRI|nr:hypothetical protein KP509_07G074300 [Ceratopteris richardii]